VQKLQKVVEEWNETARSAWYMSYRTDAVIQGILQNPASAFHPTTWTVLNEAVPDWRGAKICVPSSGDNRAVFAFAALGAEVVSCDISPVQLELAEGIADKYRLPVRFVVQDTMGLPDIPSGTFDLVYTSEGVHVWISDLPAMYRQVFRVLRPGGAYVNYEIHPFCRPFDYDDARPVQGRIVVQKPYEQTEPRGDGTKYAWRLQDILNAAAGAGLQLRRLEEMHDDPVTGHFWFYETERAVMAQEEIEVYYDWRRNPLAALPQWFTFRAVKANT